MLVSQLLMPFGGLWNLSEVGHRRWDFESNSLADSPAVCCILVCHVNTSLPCCHRQSNDSMVSYMPWWPESSLELWARIKIPLPAPGISFRHFHHNHTRVSLWTAWRIWTVTVDKTFSWLEDKLMLRLFCLIGSPRLIFRFMSLTVNISSVRVLLATRGTPALWVTADQPVTS